MTTYTAFFPFCGLGGGAIGFLQARAAGATFRSLGGIDVDPASCADFERLTSSPALCCDLARVTPAVLRTFVSERAPDVVFASPPCKGFSGLLSARRAAEPRYQSLNALVHVWVRLMLSTWATPPRLFLLENVPRIASRGAHLLAEVRRALTSAGYVLHEGSHDCGELGGLAQHRRRFLLVARHSSSVGTLLHQPAIQRVRGVGEVLGALPLPGDPAGGAMHTLPRLSWLNWVRLALIPAGGDWRDLEGVLADGQARREVHRRHQVQRWDAPASTVAGSGSNGPSAVADPRVRFYGVLRWDEASSTIAGGSHPGQGAYSVADLRAVGGTHRGTYGVLGWDEAAATITGGARPANGRFTVADPRRPPPSPVVIVAADGTWHRPLTTLELAALQGFPALIDGEPLVLHGTSSGAWRERIGNAVPPPAARAIAEQMLATLVAADGSGFRLAPTPVWVRPRTELRAEGATP